MHLIAFNPSSRKGEFLKYEKIVNLIDICTQEPKYNPGFVGWIWPMSWDF